MHLYLNYAREGLVSKVLAAEYRTALPDEGRLAKEIEKTRRLLDERAQRKMGDGQ